MKKTHQTLVTIISLIILSFFTNSAWAAYCWDNSDCDKGYYCSFEPCAIETGSCKIMPEVCLTDWDPVCGCNGLTYSNDCSAAAAGMSVDYEGECNDPAWPHVWVGDYTIENTDDIAALSGYTEVNGNLIISNTTLTNLNGLEKLTIVNGHLRIKDNDVLNSLNGLESLISVGEGLYIYGNDALTNLSGLDNIASVGKSLDIGYNNALTSLTGFENIISVGESLWISYNDALINLCALYNMNLSGNELVIYNNSALSMANANALGTQLTNNGFTGAAVVFFNNGTEHVFCYTDNLIPALLTWMTLFVKYFYEYLLYF